MAMTVREWFREMRLATPPSLELREFLRTFGRTDSHGLALERRVLFHVALVELGLKDPDHPNALTIHRMELGSCMMSHTLAHGDPLALEPRVKLMVPEPLWSWPGPFSGIPLEPLNHERARQLREGSWDTRGGDE